MSFPAIHLHLFIVNFPATVTLPGPQSSRSRAFRMLPGPACEVLLETHHGHKATRTAAASRKDSGGRKQFGWRSKDVG